jgi:phage terminase large subunit-like protein
LRPGPKPELTAPGLDLRRLPKAGGDRVIKFIETYVRIPKGKGARQPMKLRPWQREIIHGLFDEVRPRQALVSLPRGNGKTTLAAAIALYGLMADGVEGAQVLCIASDERQAGIVFGLARRMVELDSRLSERVQIFQDKLYVPATDSVLRTLPAEPGGLQGWDPSMAIVDELHVVTRPVWEAISLATGKRDHSMTLAISTPAADTDSIMWELVQLGRSGDDSHFHFVEFSAPADCEIDDEDAWHAANPALGDFLHLDGMRATLRTSRESSFRRFRLGQWVAVDDAFLPAGTWAACAAPHPIPDGATVVLGVDGSQSLDATAIVACSIGAGAHIDLVGLWEAPEGAQGWIVPILDVEDAIRAACQRWSVLAVLFDPYKMQRTMAVLEAEGLPVAKFPQSTERMTAATQGLMEAVLNRTVTHSGNVKLARHIANGVLKVGPRGGRLVKENKHSARHIDAAVAAAMAHCHATTATQPEPVIGAIWL